MSVTADPRSRDMQAVPGLLDEEALREASPGEMLHAACRVLQALGSRMGSESAFDDLARWREDASATDWNSTLASDRDSEQVELTAPDNYHDSLPGLTHAAEELSTGLDGLQTTLMGLTTRALTTTAEQQAVLGVPRTIRGPKNEKKYLEEYHGLGRRDIAQRTMRAHYTVPPPPPISGGPAPELEFPDFARSFQRGHMRTANADRLIKLTEDLKRYARRTSADPARVDAILQEMMPVLTRHAETMSVGDFHQTCREWLPKLCYYIDADGPAPEDGLEPQPAQEQFWVASRQDGGLDFGGTVFGLNAELLRTIEAAANNYAVLRRGSETTGVTDSHNSDDESSATEPKNPVIQALKANFPEISPDALASIDAAGNQHSFDGENLYDPRHRAHRAVNALFGVLIAGIGAGNAKNGLPATRGQSTKMIISMDYETLSEQLSRRHQLDDDLKRQSLVKFFSHHREGDPVDDDSPGHRFRSEGQFSGTIHPSKLRSAACDAGLIPLVFGSDSEVLNLGREKRMFSTAQYRALVARDRGCATPGCTMPAAYCQIHHITEWENGGDTNMGNAVLLCQGHHTDVHLGKWRIQRIDAKGVWFVPEPWVSPDPTPRRNAYWHH
ncbi:HNH endonuclease signature motif containing protein [Auritidibacter ignavus]|uniref:HNH endonuclease signature motif containing protein n=1 Tax=Auritidibacter ignavus TaxID=678932 RepID=A0AAJ6AHT2_9MICC|nr:MULTISPECIES: HNH endonuclease signature motif containing protein [Auritidibacter]WGH80760.1 HNH endonuclease signature motif containing protein [Auritidibacter ignavus]WGH85914.1 HNH endonuclease signature motif containing protein [Auritidibacter ignavus]WGH88201.1 HNH endonuclease signature motif containing protein [Auritidibacter ignavus]WGH92282.1 HNH endonuclease signature motif containing protein [Auritidibacter ignavus]WHS34036.1 HNH endonuclease signature motif containing protein [A